VWGCIGCGSVCEIKSLPALYKTKRSSVIALCRRDQTSLHDFSVRHSLPSATLFSEASALIAHMAEYQSLHPDCLPAIYIATPVKTHAMLTKECLRAGLAVYCEKPLARSADESQPLLNPHATSPTFVAFYRRCLPKFQSIKYALPTLGTISSVSVCLHQKRHEMSDDQKAHW